MSGDKKVVRRRRAEEGTLVSAPKSPVFEQRGDTKFFTGYTTEFRTGVVSCDQAAWKQYWELLNERERESLRRKAKWEHMTLIGTAIEWGAMDEGSKDHV